LQAFDGQSPGSLRFYVRDSLESQGMIPCRIGGDDATECWNAMSLVASNAAIIASTSARGVLMPDLDFFWNAWSTCILKVSDEFAVPLCRAHHREQHRAGKEKDWWSRNGLERLESARSLRKPHRGTRVK
jgi:hypothetical protein